jgi:uncharacterized protein (DUF1015 family)
MAKIKAFKAIRPVRDKVHLVATRPVYTYKKSILKAKLEENPFTFIRIINPEFDTTKKTKPNSVERFQHVRSKFNEFCDAGILFQDQEEALYLYRQTDVHGHAYLGVIGGASVEEYKADKIKKHEATLTSREEMFTNYLNVVGFNAEPVLLSYPHNEVLENLYEVITETRAEYEYTTTDGNKHELWVLSTKQVEIIQKAFEKIDATYIADGHHRSASSSLLADIKNAQNPAVLGNNHNYFLAFFIDENRLKILEFNRLVKSLNGLSEQEFLSKLEAYFTISPLPKASKPNQEHEFTMNLSGKWYQLKCKPEIVDESHPVACLDPEIVTRYILSPILGIHDLKTDPRIEFVSGNLGLEAIEIAISSEKAVLGIVLYPVTMQQVKVVADNQMIMPPKSTWVEPKLRSGLTIYSIEE